jgi:hypothetical protein
MNTYKHNLGTIIGGSAGAAVALFLIWNREYAHSKLLSVLLIIFIPWGSAVLGNYMYRKHSPEQQK